MRLENSGNAIFLPCDNLGIPIATIHNTPVGKLFCLIRERLAQVEIPRIPGPLVAERDRREYLHSDSSRVQNIYDFHSGRKIRSDCVRSIQDESRDILCCVYGCPFLDLCCHVVADRKVNRRSSLLRTKPVPTTPCNHTHQQHQNDNCNQLVQFHSLPSNSLPDMRVYVNPVTSAVSAPQWKSQSALSLIVIMYLYFHRSTLPSDAMTKKPLSTGCNTNVLSTEV